MAALAKACCHAMQAFDAGKFELALSNMRDIESIIAKINDRATPQRIGGRKGAELAHGSAADREKRNSEIVTAFKEYRESGLTKGQATKRVANEKSVSERTVANARKMFGE